MVRLRCLANAVNDMTYEIDPNATIQDARDQVTSPERKQVMDVLFFQFMGRTATTKEEISEYAKLDPMVVDSILDNMLRDKLIIAKEVSHAG